jgi:hypothetical protein
MEIGNAAGGEHDRFPVKDHFSRFELVAGVDPT